MKLINAYERTIYEIAFARGMIVGAAVTFFAIASGMWLHFKHIL